MSDAGTLPKIGLWRHYQRAIVGVVMLNAPQEGFGGGETQPKPYFYLFYDSTGIPMGADYKDAYYKLGVTSGPEWLFVIVDDPQDNRAKDALKDHEAGIALYARIREAMPCFVQADGRLKRNHRLESAVIHPISDFEKDIDVLYDAMGRHNPATQSRILEYLRHANNIIPIKKPINLHYLIELLIDRFDPDNNDGKPDHR